MAAEAKRRKDELEAKNLLSKVYINSLKMTEKRQMNLEHETEVLVSTKQAKIKLERMKTNQKAA